MRLRKLFILFYLANLFLLAVVTAYNKKLETSAQSIYFYLFPLIFTVVGLVCGGLLYYMRSKPDPEKRIKSFRIGFIVGVVFFAVMLMLTRLITNDPYLQRNIRHNREAIKYLVYDDEPYFLTAFDALENKFEKKNIFRLSKFSALQTDSTYYVYFTYSIIDDKNQYYSRVTVVGQNATVDVYNQKTENDSEYMETAVERKKGQILIPEDIENTFAKLPDSTRKKIIELVR